MTTVQRAITGPDAREAAGPRATATGGAAAPVRRGPHGGVWVEEQGGGGIEISIYKRGMPPRFELFFYDTKGKPQLPPVGAALEVTRPEGRRQTFRFARYGYSLESTADVPGPHEFSIRLTVPREGSLLVHNVRFTRYPGAYESAAPADGDGTAVGKPLDDQAAEDAAAEGAGGPWTDRLRQLVFPGLGATQGRSDSGSDSGERLRANAALLTNMNILSYP